MKVKTLYTDDEKALLLRVARGNEQAFETIFHHYQAYVYTAAFKFTGNADLSEEIVQDVFLKIWLKKEMLSEIQFFPAFLYKVAVNIILPALRKANKERAFNSAITHHLPDQSTISDSVIQKEYEQILEAAIARLPEKQRQTYLLAKKQDLKREEIAKLMGVSAETVKSNLDQALRSIRAYCMAHLQTVIGLLLLFDQP